MLALKDLHLEVKPALASFADLPGEILDLILSNLYKDDGGSVRNILASSRTNRALRNAAAPILFEVLTLDIDFNSIAETSLLRLQHILQKNVSIGYHVRHLRRISTLPERSGGQPTVSLKGDLTRTEVVQALRLMTGLKKVSTNCCNNALLPLLRDACLTQPLEILIEGCNCTALASPATLPLRPTFLFVLPPSRHFEFPMPLPSREFPVVALSCFINPSQLLSLDSIRLNTKLRELDIQQSHQHTWQPNTSVILKKILTQFKALERLSADGADVCDAVLSALRELRSLRKLRLVSTSERIFHAHLEDGLPYMGLPELESLQIGYISRYLTMRQVIPADLQSLRIEFHDRTDRINAFDLKWMAENMNQLETLELNVGSLTNLWHPTAVAGVDVDVEVYRLLDILKLFKRLRVLRLFPSYWTSRQGILHFEQPLTDEQAVKVFNHLHSQSRTLQLLVIGNTGRDYLLREEIYARQSGDPMKWVVRAWGSRTLLITHQARKRYHLEQIWEGDRRLTMRNIRHQGTKRHFDELHDWDLPHFEFSFDVPGTCSSLRVVPRIAQ